MQKQTIDHIEVAGRRVLMRVDYNVPLDSSGAISDDRRIAQSLPSVRSVVDRGGRLILMSHLGRPKGTGPEAGLSLRPAAERLESLLGGVRVGFPGDDCIGEAARDAVAALPDGEVILLENLRFHAGEKKGDATFAAGLAAFGDVYCNDAFGTAHREDASMYGVPLAMKGRPRVAGLLLARELERLGGAVGPDAARPRVAVLGGAKVSDKLGVIRNLLERFDTILVGGAMAYTLLAARGVSVGTSRLEREMIADAESILREAESSGATVHQPEDNVCAAELAPGVETTTTGGEDIPDGLMGLDIGPRTAAVFAAAIEAGRTVVWNGPMGVFETPPFDAGSRAVARALVAVTEAGASTVVGGGDTAAAIEVFGLADGVSHVSTGGGASLQMLEGRPFASVELLDGAS